MKAVVVEIRDGQAAVLKEDGTFAKVNRECRLGETIEVPDPISKGTFSLKTSILVRVLAAMMAMSLLAGGVHYETAMACSYVAVDVNPSFEFALNRLDRVISVTALNKDGEEVAGRLQSMDIRGKTLSAAIDLSETVLSDMGYLEDDEDEQIIISVTSESESRSEALEEEVGRAEKKTRNFRGMRVFRASKEERETAEREGMGPGRYQMLQEREAAKPDAEEAPNGTVKEDMERSSSAVDDSETENIGRATESTLETNGDENGPVKESQKPDEAREEENKDGKTAPEKNTPSGEKKESRPAGPSQGNGPDKSERESETAPNQGTEPSPGQGAPENGTNPGAEPAPGQGTNPGAEPAPGQGDAGNGTGS
ncbi:MAG: hypothetical protein K5989_09015, partial [Lachnospiraceae bacterium]|nr:hypothetical protein [Lachnospiraceae bacterium]